VTPPLHQALREFLGRVLSHNREGSDLAHLHTIATGTGRLTPPAATIAPGTTGIVENLLGARVLELPR
jgi:hypothetical protein